MPSPLTPDPHAPWEGGGRCEAAQSLEDGRPI